MDTRGLRQPDLFDGTASKWRYWKVVTSSYSGACHEGLVGLMTRAKETEGSILHATLVNKEARVASTQLAFVVLVLTCRAAVLVQVVNAGPLEELTTRSSLCRRFEL